MSDRRVTFDALFAFCDLHASRVGRGLSLDLEKPLESFMARMESRPQYFDRQGFPIPGDGELDPTLVWARQFERNVEYRKVAHDDLPDGSWLSTVWLGLDHQWGFGPPMIFETMRFARELAEMEHPFLSHPQQYYPTLEFPDPETGEMTEQLRYATEEEALACHHEIVRRIRVREGH